MPYPWETDLRPIYVCAPEGGFVGQIPRRDAEHELLMAAAEHELLMAVAGRVAAHATSDAVRVRAAVVGDGHMTVSVTLPGAIHDVQVSADIVAEVPQRRSRYEREYVL